MIDYWVQRGQVVARGDLWAILSAIDERVFPHSRRVGEVATRVAEELGLPAHERGTLLEAGLFHDLGKIAVPLEILHKPGPLTVEERAIMEFHVEETQRLLWEAGMVHICRAAREHHEALDGSGYPYGLQADEISLHGRVIAVADCFDALTEDRPYRPALDVDAALAIMADAVGRRYDAEIFGALVALTRRHDLAELIAPRAGRRLPSLRRAMAVGLAAASTIASTLP